MIKIAGATYTGYFTKHNHAILCRKPMGEKFDKAREWRVDIELLPANTNTNPGAGRLHPVVE